MEIVHVAFPVNDLDATKRFYLDGLGLAFSREFVGETGVHNYYVRGETGAELQFTAVPNETLRVEHTVTDPLRRHVAIRVDDIEERFERVVARTGCQVLREPSFEAASGAHVAFVADPDGHVVELVQRA